MPNTFLKSALAILLLTASAAAADDSWLTSLARRVSDYLNSDVVQRAHVSAAVAAVRGGAPTDEGEDLDVRLLDRAALLRQAVLEGGAASADVAELRRVYDALAVSYWAQALGEGPAASARADILASLGHWTKKPRDIAIPEALARLLTSAEALDEKRLVAAGWGAYCRAITPQRPPIANAAASSAAWDADTARLEELLAGLRSSWTEKNLGTTARARAHYLAGQVTLALSQAPLQRRALGATAGGSAPRLKLSDAPPSAPARDGAPEAEFSPKALYARAAPAVVLIVGASPQGSGEIGSGSLIDSSGHVLTNAHVVIRDSDHAPWPSLRVYLKPATMTGDPAQDLTHPINARVAAYDAKLDLALLELASAPPIPATLRLADPKSVAVGDRVAAIGHPEQGGLWTLTTGIISAGVAELGGVKGRAAFQTDTSINRGNSGGPLLDAAGEIVGVNTLMSRRAADGLAITAVNFAIRSDVARRWLEGAGAPPEPAPALASAPLKATLTAPPAVAPARKATAKTPKPANIVVTESRPFDGDTLIQRSIREMEDLGEEMHEDIQRRRR